ncbi:MAG TPA: SpoIIE family protein phosphatase [Candidatus Hydrogenedentes bacterium]|nr:SpoIIE family protein phosphatase [Candidatus Hydrogenedentota bacterium]
MKLTAENKYQLLRQISLQIRDTLDLDEILNQLLDMIQSTVSYDAAGIFVLNQDLIHARHEQPKEMIASVVWRGFDARRPPEMDPMLSLGKGLIGHVISTGESLVVPDVRLDPRYVVGREGTLSEIVVPIVRNNQPIGALNLESNQLAAYNQQDVEVLLFFADAASISIEKAMLHRQLLENKQIEMQLKMAQAIQSRLLPAEPPVIAGYDIAGTCLPTFEIGGDYYDFIHMPQEQWGLVVADVSGEGIPAAMIMAIFRALLRTHARAGGETAVIAQTMNRLLPDFTGGIDFVTAVFGVLVPDSGQFTYTNCGHNPPLLLRADGRVDTLTQGGPLLSILLGAVYRAAQVTLQVGDLLVLYTDGVVEVMSKEGEEFGLARLQAVLQAAHSLPAQAIIERIIQATQVFSGAANYRDDFTCMVVKRG